MWYRYTFSQRGIYLKIVIKKMLPQIFIILWRKSVGNVGESVVNFNCSNRPASEERVCFSVLSFSERVCLKHDSAATTVAGN